MYGAWALWYLTAAAFAGMVELVDAPDSKSGGLRPLGVRVPLPALGIAPEDHIEAFPSRACGRARPGVHFIGDRESPKLSLV